MSGSSSTTSTVGLAGSNFRPDLAATAGMTDAEGAPRAAWLWTKCGVPETGAQASKCIWSVSRWSGYDVGASGLGGRLRRCRPGGSGQAAGRRLLAGRVSRPRCWWRSRALSPSGASGRPWARTGAWSARSSPTRPRPRRRPWTARRSARKSHPSSVRCTSTLRRSRGSTLRRARSSSAELVERAGDRGLADVEHGRQAAHGVRTLLQVYGEEDAQLAGGQVGAFPPHHGEHRLVQDRRQVLVVRRLTDGESCRMRCHCPGSVGLFRRRRSLHSMHYNEVTSSCCCNAANLHG